MDSKDSDDSNEECSTSKMVPDLSVSSSIPVNRIKYVLEILGTGILLRVNSRRIMEGMGGCASKPRRWLNLKSIFVKGCNQYKLFDGIPSFKKYRPGISGSLWVPVDMIEKSFAYMKQSTGN